MVILLALLPLLVAILLLLVLQRNSRDVGWTTLGMTVALVSLVPSFHRTPWQVLLSFGEGAATMVTACVILLPALLFYQMQQETGAITLLARGLTRFVPDRDLQTLLLVLGVGPYIESLCGFGCGSVAILPLLIHLHQNKLKAIQLSLLSQIVVAWGGLSIGSVLAANLSGVAISMLSVRTSLLLFPSTIGFSILALQMSGGRTALERYWGHAVLAGGLLMLATCLCSQFFIVEVAGVIAGGCVIAFFLTWGWLTHASPASLPNPAPNDEQKVPLWVVICPYVLLTAGVFATRLLPVVHTWVQTYGVLVYPAIKLHLAVLYSPGIWLLLAALMHIPLFSLQRTQFMRVQKKTGKQFLPGAIAMMSFLATAALMQDCGMTDTLGEAVAMLGKNYMWIASLVGAGSGWLTNTLLGGNALAVPMQMDANTHLGLPLPWLIAAQNAAAAIATTVSPSRMILLATAGGILGKEGLLFRKIGPVILWSVALTTLLFVWFTSSTWLNGVLVLLVLLVIVNIPVILVVVGDRRGSVGKRDETLTPNAAFPDPDENIVPHVAG